MLYSAFVISFPSFARVSAETVQAKLDEAALEIDPGVWGRQFDKGHGLLTAMKLGELPMGRSAKLVAQDSTVFAEQYRALLRQVTVGFRGRY